MARTIGTMKCRGIDCDEKVAVGETAGSSLSCKCAFCGFSAYASPGTKAARRIRAAMQAFDDVELAQDDAPAAKPAPVKAVPAPTPTPKPRNSVFSLADLS